MLFYQSYWHSSAFVISFTVNDVNNCVFVCSNADTFDYNVVTAVCQLLINGYVMLSDFACTVNVQNVYPRLQHKPSVAVDIWTLMPAQYDVLLSLL